MIEQFVPYEIALKLKEAGFDEPCLAAYNQSDENKFMIAPQLSSYQIASGKNSDVGKIEKVTAPLWQQAIDWLSDVHNIEVDALRYTYSGGKYMGKCYMWFVDQYDPKYNHELEEDDSHWILNARKSQGYDFKTRREAILVAITEALKLI